MKNGKAMLVMMCGMLAMGSSALAQDDGATSAVTSIGVSTSAIAPLGWTTAMYCSQKTQYSKGETSREVYRRFTKCLVGMIPDWGKGTTEGLKWTGKELHSVPEATAGTSEGTTDGLSDKEQQALIEAVQEDLMGVVGGAEASALSEQLIQVKRDEIAFRKGEAFAADMPAEQLAADVVRELESLR